MRTELTDFPQIQPLPISNDYAVSVAEILLPAFPELEGQKDSIIAQLRSGRIEDDLFVCDHKPIPIVPSEDVLVLIGTLHIWVLQTELRKSGEDVNPIAITQKLSPDEFLHLCECLVNKRWDVGTSKNSKVS